MIKPLDVTITDYWDAIKAGKPTHIRMTFTDQNIVLEDQDIEASTGVTITNTMNDSENIQFGRAVCKQFSSRIILSSRTAGLKWADRFKLEFGVAVSLVTKWVTVGYFNGVRPKNVTTVGVVDYIAYDDMIKFDVSADDFLAGLTYPIDFEDIFTQLGQHIGVNVSYPGAGTACRDAFDYLFGTAFPSNTLKGKNYSCRDILSKLAEVCGGYAVVKPSGNVNIIWFENVQSYGTYPSITPSEEFYIDHADVIEDGVSYTNRGKYTSMVIKYSETESYGSYTANTYVMEGNPFTRYYLIRQNISQILYTRLSNMDGILSMSVDCIGCWLIEPGDIISVELPSGEVIDMPVFAHTFHWNGSPSSTLEASGDSGTGAEPVSYGSASGGSGKLDARMNTTAIRCGSLTSGTVKKNDTTTFHITFPGGYEFESEPFVMATITTHSRTNVLWITDVDNITTTGFDVSLAHNNASDDLALGNARRVDWIAIKV